MELEELKKQVKIKMFNLQLGYSVAEYSLEKLIEELIVKDGQAYEDICDWVHIEAGNIRHDFVQL